MSVLVNHQLFAESYLDELRKEKLPPETPAACQQTIREWREEYPHLEQQTELMAFLAQSLSALGFSYERRQEPEHFILYADETHSQPLGVCLAVVDDDIGRMTKGRHHQARLIGLLRALGLGWGIVSNGRAWRLCNARSPAPYEVWLEANLEAMLATRQLGEFLLFYRFFSCEAFTFMPEPNGPAPLQGLDALLADSEARTQAIERHLRNRVDEILQALCLGFVADESGSKLGGADLDKIYSNAIYLLYRVLFVFYAEARQLLPVSDEAYQQISLERLIEFAWRWQVEGTRDPDPFALWKRLTHLCVVVDDGSEEAQVNPYNGGLFSDSEKPYLRQHKMTNDFLAPALFDLAFMETRTGARRIDYRDLSVRHLGTLYEGLLEYRLNLVEDEPVVVRESKGKRTYIPQSLAGAVKRGETILEVGKIYFSDDKGERKSSGSYYTPEDVVQYIVSQTLLPKLQERAAAIRDLAQEAARERTLAVSAAERASLESFFDRRLLEHVERDLLSLKILDPAMGSAHFLVAAGQMLTNLIVETLNALDWAGEISTDPLVWKRRVVERCLYGVDVNPLAQELAKLALWLTSAAEGKPLTFLDHHLKIGNSLYGAPLAALGMLPGTAKGKAEPMGDLFRHAYQRILSDVLAQLASITASDSERIEDVKSKGKAYHAALAQAQRLRDVANVWLATLFGLAKPDGKPLNEADYFALLSESIKDYSPETWDAYVDGQPVVLRAREIARQNKFLHWELEFPDTLVNDRCQFDVIIANPPYVKTHPEKPILKLFSTAKCADLYAWIIERAIDFSGENGLVGTIIPLSIMFAGDKKTLRQKLLETSANINLISCDNRPDAIFEAPGLPPNRQRTTIVILHKTGQPKRIFTTDYLRWARSERPIVFQSLRFAEITDFANTNYFPSIGKSELVNFYSRLLHCPKTINDYVLKDGKEFLCVPSAACYYISAVPLNLGRRNQEILLFNDVKIRDALFAIVNSNVFFWYWRMRSDGFWVSREQILSMPVPDLFDQNDELLDLASQLWQNSKDYAVTQRINGKMVTSYLFNKRMDLLMKIDNWLISRIAPNSSLSPADFAQYKSNSFMQTLDLSKLQDEDLESEE